MSALSPQSTPRAFAASVAKWLLSRGRSDDAVRVLAAWAVTGPNDEEGQSLLAEAMRISPTARVAKSAFERMVGVAGEHGELEAAIARYTPEELTRIEIDIRRPTFQRVQIGFDDGVRFRDKSFRVQTENSGRDEPLIVTHLFADDGRLIKTHRRSYAAEVNNPATGPYVRSVMKAQQMEMIWMLRRGSFDDIVAGTRAAAVETLTGPPVGEVRKMGGRVKREQERAAPPVGESHAAAAGTTRPPPDRTRADISTVKPDGTVPQENGETTAALRAPAVPAFRKLVDEPTGQMAPLILSQLAAESLGPAVVRFSLFVERARWNAPDRFAPRGEVVFVGRNDKAHVYLQGERYCAPREAVLRWRDGRLFVEDFEGGAGVFVRIKTPVELELGDDFVIGDQLVRILENPIPNVRPDQGPTYVYTTPTRLSKFRVVQIWEGGHEGACFMEHGTTVVCGRGPADLVLANDRFADDQHCVVEEQAGSIVLTDLDSRTGVFVRVSGEHEISNGDEILIGRTRLRVELPGP